jgi:hypothetical protein
MRNGGPLWIACLAVGCLLSTRCASDHGPVQPLPLPTEAPLEVSAVEAGMYPYGGYTCIDVTVRNSNSVAQTWICADCCMYVVALYLPQGPTAVVPGGCCDHVTHQTFAPGEVFTVNVCWEGPTRAFATGDTIPPGTYWAAAGLSHGSSEIARGDSVRVTIR